MRNLPAFPQYHRKFNDDDGMTLRDYFAGQALVGLVAGRREFVKEFAKEAYLIADAMLAERNV